MPPLAPSMKASYTFTFLRSAPTRKAMMMDSSTRLLATLENSSISLRVRQALRYQTRPPSAAVMPPSQPRITRSNRLMRCLIATLTSANSVPT